MENDSPNLFDSEPMSVNLAFPENKGDDDVLTEILEEIHEDDRRPPVIENTSEMTNSNIDELPVDTFEYHTDDSDENDGTADDLPVEADPNQSTESQKEDSSNAKTKDIHKGLPPGRVKLIMKMDPDVNIVASDAVFLLTKATEQFVGLLAQHCHKAMVATNKKTLQKKHIDSVIEDSVPFEFLEGTLDW
ncbi:DNA polymerase epsilon subunit 4-like [Melanaphis sacchari]|uniref:DNA polymerase epsilon subunit 4-like n=1 Tax=Melanaphis sacchari TaxID=742174 RepID=UPI000DC14DF5|nr:DNA polymerase epsilon subunit 4-like [Melanaphis sacchari]